MNIGIVTTWFERGAAYVSRQYRDIIQESCEVFIYARGGESFAIGNPDWDNDRVTWGKKPYVHIPTAINLEDFKAWLISKNIKIVFFNEQFWWDPVLLCNEMGIITGSYIDYYTEQTVPYFDCFDFLICNTLRHQSVFDWHPHSFYVPWGTDVDLFHPTCLTPVTPGVVTFFHSGGISPHRKGTDLVIKAFANLDVPARLVIHAQQNLKSFFPKLASLIEALENNGRLVCHEQTVPAPGLFHLGDVYVYPTRLDGIGLTMIEAAACGLPVIASNDGPMNEFVKHELNGRLVKIDRLVARKDGYYWPQCMVDLSDLTRQMLWYAERLDQLEGFKRSAREDAMNRFDWKKNSREILRIFESVKKRSAQEIIEATQTVAEFERDRSLKYQATKYEIFKINLEYHYPTVFKFCSSALAGMRRLFSFFRFQKVK